MTHVDATHSHPGEPGVIALTLAYDGAPFAGFASQPGQQTVQGTLEDALETCLRRRVDLAVAGRTDAGVHALGQVVSFEALGDEPDPVSLARSLNALAEPHISVREVRRAQSGFSARFDAISREYRYRIATGSAPPIFTSDVSWWVKGSFDLDAMCAGAEMLVGEHDFKSFCVTESAKGKPTHRRVMAIEVDSEQHLGEDHLVVRVLGNAFLHSMVRVVVGTLVEVGTGRRPPEWVAEALTACERSAAGPTAPAHGLTLWSVGYPNTCWSEAP